MIFQSEIINFLFYSSSISSSIIPPYLVTESVVFVAAFLACYQTSWFTTQVVAPD